MAAQLAARGLTSSAQSLDASCGFWALFGGSSNPEAAVKGLGSDYEILRNAFKPYACGVVVHPAIDGALAIRAEVPLQTIASIEVRAHPLVLALTGKPRPQTGLEGKFSIYHCAAAALIRGACGPAEFTDATVKDPQVVGLRDRVAVQEDESLGEDEAVVRAILEDGATLTRHVAHATGSASNPTSDTRLQEKYVAMAGAVLGTGAASKLAETVWSLEQVEDMGSVARTAAPR